MSTELKNILHLTDFHISDANKSDFDELCRNINDAIKKMGEEHYPQIVLATGDFTETGNQDEFKWFREGFQRMLTLCCFSKVEHIMLLGGNHDYSWSVKETRQENYLSLCAQVEKGLQYSDKVKDNKKYNTVKYIFIEGNTKNILVVGMDSMKIDSPDWPGIGYFTKEQLREVTNVIEECNKKNKAETQIFVAFHHHLVPISVLERDTLSNPQKFSITLDARRAINFFLDNRVEFAVHGHQHQPSMITWKDDENNQDDRLHIISAGCLAGKNYAGENARNSFMLYTIFDNKVAINQAETSERDSEEFVWKTVEYPDPNGKYSVDDHKDTGLIDRERILALAEQDDRWISRADEAGALTIRGLVEKLVDSIAEDGSVAYEVDTKRRYRTSTLATVVECMDDIGLLPEEDLLIMQRKLLSLKDYFNPIDESDDIITKDENDLPAWGIDEAPSVWTTSKALTALFTTKFIPSAEEEKKSIAESVEWLAVQAYNNGGWGYQKYPNNLSCADNVPMTALAMKALSLALLDDQIKSYINAGLIIDALEAGLEYLKRKKVEPKETKDCFWTYEDSPNLSASIWALEAWHLSCRVVNKKKYYSRVYSKIKPKILEYVIEHLPEKEDDEKWTECFFRAKKEAGLKYKSAPLNKEKAFYSFTPYLISYYIKEDIQYTSNPKVLSVIKWVLAHRGDSWLIEHNYNSKNACTISVAMAINVIVNWFKAMANNLIEQETEKLFLNS